MKIVLSVRQVVTIALCTALLLVAGRLVKAHFDASYFITAGTDFVDGSKTPVRIVVQPGQGYDGQFFYRYATDPFHLRHTIPGVHVDHPPYRAQRIAYPVLGWLLALGGRPVLVPWALILVNMLSFAGIFLFTGRFVKLAGGNMWQALVPLSFCGLYMSLGRDLSEVVELFFFTGAVYYLFISRVALFVLFATLTLLSRETSAIALLPLAVMLFIQRRRAAIRIPLLFLVIPFAVFAGWKAFIYHCLPSAAEAAAGYSSVDIPFRGMWQGFRVNFDLHGAKNIMQFLFWAGYLLWQGWLCFLVIRAAVSSGRHTAVAQAAWLKVMFFAWLAFAISFSLNIYTDDWGFVRIFSEWNMTGVLLLILLNRKTPVLFNVYSALLALLTIIRLIVRV